MLLHLKIPEYVSGSIDGGSMLDKSKLLILFISQVLFRRIQKGAIPRKKAVVPVLHFNVSEVREFHVFTSLKTKNISHKTEVSIDT